jgi:hypothetical protein
LPGALRRHAWRGGIRAMQERGGRRRWIDLACARVHFEEEIHRSSGGVKAQAAKIFFVGRGDLYWRVIPNETRR